MPVAYESPEGRWLSEGRQIAAGRSLAYSGSNNVCEVKPEKVLSNAFKQTYCCKMRKSTRAIAKINHLAIG